MTTEEAVKAYWLVSLALNQRREATNITTSGALRLISQHVDESYRWKRVHFKLSDLRENIIHGKGRKANG